MQESTFVCGLCHNEHPISERTIFDDTMLCPDCYETETVTCSYCGERIWAEDAESDDYRCLCLH